MNVPDASWPIRNVRFAAPAGIRWKSQKMTIRRTNATPKASVGATKAGITTLCASPCHWTPLVHDCAIAAPTSPPISARAEERADAVAEEPVALVLERAEIDQLPARVLEPLQPLDRLVELDRR